jgi:hypothetical protein
MQPDSDQTSPMQGSPPQKQGTSRTVQRDKKPIRPQDAHKTPEQLELPLKNTDERTLDDDQKR